MASLGNGPFLYLIQDYEAAFYPFGSLYAFARETYDFCYRALVSTEPLFNFMRAEVKHFDKLCAGNEATYFNNACSAKLPDRKTFLNRHRRRVKKFAFYSRPMVNRNMFELGSLAIIEAWQQGRFDSGHNWELYGIGIGDVEIYLDGRTKITQLPRMSLSEYQESIGEFDICLSLMASPHPSITPFDMAGVGAIVITNCFANKTREYFGGISKNIIVARPDVQSLLEAIELAIDRVDDLEYRFDNAVSMAYPREWQSVWQDDHRDFIRELFGPPGGPKEVDVQSLRREMARRRAGAHKRALER
jgi:hypothetical protein